MERLHDDFGFSTNGSSAGTLPISVSLHTHTDQPATEQVSHLQDFIASALTQSSHTPLAAQMLTKFIGAQAKTQQEGKVPVTPTTDSWTGDTGTMGFDSYYPFGDGGMPTEFSLEPIQTVTMTGQKESLVPWWTYDNIFVNPIFSGGSPPGPCLTPGSVKIDWTSISNHEGNSFTGYIPKDNTGAYLGTSGVTIASGFDLGAHNVTDLQHLNLNSALTAQLTPYLGLHTTDAGAYLQAHPLTISYLDALEINSAAHSEALGRLITQYDNAVNFPGSFLSLPAAAQTAIADLTFQYGSVLSRPIWGHITSSNWAAVIDDLNNFGDKYTTRRHDEANLLQTALNNGQLINGSAC